MELVPESGFRHVVEYPTSRGTWKQVVLFLAQASGEPKADGKEIRESCWLTPENARKRMKADQHPVLDRLIRKFAEEKG